MESQDVKVVLRNPEGKYIAGSAINWEFVEDRCRAIVFDYFSQRVEEKIEFLRVRHGLVLEAERLSANEVYESCDDCHRLMMPFKTFFDGERFLCSDCRAKDPAKPDLSRIAA